MAYARAGHAVRVVVIVTLTLVASAWLVRRLQPADPATLADDPVRQIEALALRHRSLPWRDVPLHRLGPACNRHDAPSCTALALAYADVRLVAEEQFGMELPCAERPLLERACDGDDARGCMFLGHLAYGGRCEAGSARRAYDLYDRACRMGLAAACGQRDAIDTQT